MRQERIPVSAVVLTYNEVSNIGRCLQPLLSLCREVVVVDSGSSDGTQEIARNMGARVVEHEFENYSAQRNWAQHNSDLRYEWIFHIDAGEKVSEELACELCALFQDSVAADGYLVPRRTVFMGRALKYGGLYPVYHLRLLKKEKGFCEGRAYDQHFMVDGACETLHGELLDYVATDLDDWTEKHVRWARAEVMALQRGSDTATEKMVAPRLGGSPIERRRWYKRQYYRFPPLVRPFIYFLVRYVLLGGFLDGRPGLLYHVLQGFWFRFYIDALLLKGGLAGGDEIVEK